MFHAFHKRRCAHVCAVDHLVYIRQGEENRREREEGEREGEEGAGGWVRGRGAYLGSA